MTNTPFSKKCEILYSLMSESNIDEPCLPADFIADFIDVNDLTIPLVILYRYGYCTPTGDGVTLIEDSWRDLCLALGVDHYGDYNSIDDIAELYNAKG